VNGATCIMVQMPSFGKHQFEVDLVGIMPEKDVALVKFRPDDIARIINALGKMPQLKLGDSDGVVRSQEILALGYPLGQQSLKSTTGVISGRELGMIQMSAPINPGSSGGPSLNAMGEVIGINTAGVASAQNVGYIIAINDLKNVLDQLREGGLIRKPYLGIFQAMATADLVTSLGNPLPGGTYVVDVLCDSPLYDQLKPGDMVYAINGVPVDLYGEMKVDWSEDKITTAEYVSRLKKGQKVSIKVYRKGKPMTFECIFERKKCAPVRHVFAEYEELEYEIVGGFVIMPLMMNHLPILMQVSSGLSKYAEEKNQSEPALVVTHVLPNSVAFKERLKLAGSILQTVNDVEVKTLDDLRKAIKKTKNIITMETTDHILVALDLEKICKTEPEMAKSHSYKVTECMKILMKKCEEKK
jgi:serine protease Do